MNNKPILEYTTLEELKDHFLKKAKFILETLEDETNAFDIEGNIYALRALAEAVHQQMHRINSR